jgi:hypothetical protein
MDPAEPADASEQRAQLIVVEQACTIETSLRVLLTAVIELAVPRAVLACTTRADRLSRPSPVGTPDADIRIRITTDALASVAFEFSKTPLTLLISGNPARLIGRECGRVDLFAFPTNYFAKLFAARSD